MGRVSLDDLDKYNSGGGGGRAKFFSLKDDGDTEAVHILLEGQEDISNYTYVTHKIRVGKQKFASTHVNCLRSYSDPLDKCPFCANADGKDILGASVRVFIPLWNINAEEVQFFDRPKVYVAKLQKMIHRYGEDDFMLHTFDIERNGEKGDQQTTYDFIETELDEEFELDADIPEVLGSAVYDATADDMEYFLDNGQLPPSGSKDEDDEEEPVRRRSKKKDEEPPFDEDEDDEEERPRRRSRERDTGRKVSARNSRRSRNAEDEF